MPEGIQPHIQLLVFAAIFTVSPVRVVTCDIHGTPGFCLELLLWSAILFER